jgi:predicted Holliday junction resolvase-like endonuclease
MAFSDTSVQIAVAILVAFLAGFVIGRILRHLSVRRERADAVGRSRSTILGELYEKVMPFLPGFPFAPKDLVFIGKGFDYLVLDGLAEGEVKEIVFMEVKSGTSSLNRNERAIRDAVRAKRVRWTEYRPDGGSNGSAK